MQTDLLSYIETLTAPEVDRKAQLEATIERGMQTFVEVGLALMEIRDGRLYRAEFGTFEEYCQERCWFSQKKRQESFSASYVSAIVAAAGFSIDGVSIDEDSIDVQIKQRGSPDDPNVYPLINILQVQLKCTYSDRQRPRQDGFIHFELSRKNYDDLRRNDACIPTILVVLYIPSGNEAHWILEEPSKMTLHHTAHWMSLRGETDLAIGQGSKVVLVPIPQRFDVEGLRGIMGRLAVGGLP